MRLRFFHIGMICNRRSPCRKRESITVCFSNRLSKMEMSLPSLEKEDRENLPDVYVSYVSDYVSLINTYLNKLPEEQRGNILSFYEAWSIPDVVMSDYLALATVLFFAWRDAGCRDGNTGRELSIHASNGKKFQYSWSKR